MSRVSVAIAVTGFLLLNGDDRAWAQPQHVEEQVDIMILQGSSQTGAVAPVPAGTSATPWNHVRSPTM